MRRCRELGFPISDIRTLLELSHSDVSTCAEAGKIGTENLMLVRDKITDLRQMEQALRELVASCRKGRKDCPMLKELFGD